jgi:hypothetical protein
MPAPVPAPASTTTSAPSRTNFFTVSGVAETRFSPGWVSQGMTNCIVKFAWFFGINAIPVLLDFQSADDYGACFAWQE